MNKNIGVSKEVLFDSWVKQIGENKAFLLACNYPISRVLLMTEEEATSEVEAIS